MLHHPPLQRSSAGAPKKSAAGHQTAPGRNAHLSDLFLYDNAAEAQAGREQADAFADFGEEQKLLHPLKQEKRAKEGKLAKLEKKAKLGKFDKVLKEDKEEKWAKDYKTKDYKSKDKVRSLSVVRLCFGSSR